MVNKCCVPDCRSGYEKNDKISSYKFPKDEEQRNLWVRAIPINNLEIKQHTRVCRKHWPDEITMISVFGKLRPRDPPSIFSNITSSLLSTSTQPQITSKSLFSVRNKDYQYKNENFKTHNKLEYTNIISTVTNNYQNLVAYESSDSIFIQSKNIIFGIPKFVLHIKNDLTYEAFFLGSPCAVPSFYKKEIKICFSWSVFEKIIRHLSSQKSDHKQDNLIDQIKTMAGKNSAKKSKCKDSNQLSPETSNLGTSSNFTAQSTRWEFIDVVKKEPSLLKDDINKEITFKEEFPIKEEILFPTETTVDSSHTNDSFSTFEDRTNDSSLCSENTTRMQINQDELNLQKMQLHHRVSPRLPWPEEEESSGAEMDEDPLSIEIEDLEERNSLYHKAPSRTRSREQESTAHSFETHKKRTKIDN